MLRPLLRSIQGALILVQLSVGGVFAGAVSFPELSDLLPGKTDTTYADLVRLVAPSAFGGETPSDEGAPRIRHIGGGEDITLGSDNSFRGLAALSVRSGGMDRVALLLDLEPEYTLGLAILALFDVSDEPVLLDAVDVAEDRHTFFADPARLPVSANDDLLVTLSTHHNAGQSYAIAVPILVLDDRFELVDMVFMLGEWNCSYSRSQSFSIRLGPGGPFADIVATVADRSEENTDVECGDMTFPVAESREITVTYRWNPAARKYVRDSDAFDRLARENEERL